MASTCGIPMNNLSDITESTGVCPLTEQNCENFDKVYKLMKGALFYKINSEQLWTGYTQGWNLVKANLLNCDGFEVLQDILSEVLPSLNLNMPKCHKIHRPAYSTQTDDNMYSYINTYNTFLKFESLGAHKRTYTPYEIAASIADDIELDPHKRFDKGVDHIRSQLKSSPDGVSVPKDIGLNKIAKTICKYCSEYQVGEHATPEDTVDRHVINALQNKPWQRKPPNNDYQRNSNKPMNKRVPKDMSLKCPFCGQLGHDDKSDQGCMVFAKWTLCQQASQRVPPEDIKMNTRKFLKSIRQRQSDARQRTQLTKHINTLQQMDTTLDTTNFLDSLQQLTTTDQYDSAYDSEDSE